MKVSYLDSGFRKKIIPSRPLLTASIELTSYCNLDCIHCYIKRDNNAVRKVEISAEEVCNILSQMRDAGVVYLNLTGGEPLLRPDFKDIYLFAKKKNFAVTVITNGTLITKEMVEFFKKYPPLILEISSYGITADVYESVTGTPGSFAMFQKALGMLKGSGIRVLVRFITMKNNYKQAAEAETHIHSMGMRFRCYYSLWLRLDRDKARNAVIKKQRLNVKETIELFNIMTEDLRKFYPCEDSIDRCGAGTIGCVVDSQGWLMPCYYLPGPRISLKKASFKKAWELLAPVKTPVQKKQSACKDCRHVAYCKWCPGVSYLETGNSEKKITHLCNLMDGLSRIKAIGC
ncbi:MAG: radical SAM protein [Candidatus Omnitrophota bacterium]|nr:radical SAM protein [Candidatus Omnitrophota bacterium]